MHALLLLAFAVAPVPEADDTHDLVVLHPKRPIRLRLHLRAAGRPFLTAWSQHIARLFRYLDANKDGRLSAAELNLAPGREQWLHITSGERVIDPEAAPPMAEVAGGKPFATLADLEAYYARATSGPLQMHWRPLGPNGDQEGSELWRAMVPGGHPLTVARVKDAPKLMARYDTDEDETISAPELLGFTNPNVFFNPPPPGTRGKPHGPAAYGLPFFSCRPDQRDAGLADVLRKQYPKLAGTAADPDLVLRVHVGEPTPPTVVRRHPSLVVQPTRGGVQIAIEDWLVHIGLDVDPSFASLREDARGRFKRLDADSNGYLDKKEVYRPPFEYVAWLRLADRDGDGTITEAEFLGFAELIAGLNGKTTVVRVADVGQSLYRLLDADGDGRLSRRELVEGWRNLGPGLAKGYAVNGLPQLYRVSIGHDRALPGDLIFGRVQAFLPPRGPLWFRKMDLNSDGDVSRREWLGTREEFDLIDADGDGLIGVEEAEAYDRIKRR